MTKTTQGFLIASAVASLFATGCHSSAAQPKAKETAQIRCEGANACKGKSACETKTHACAGQNACKGQGWITTTAQDCAAKGGKAMD